ncbi:odorant receptor 13a [Harpegnathos saltator]|uniref:odorant receptor 13a n=1 Tax=Harpegnathos saltator TaxID=610380 RepID=UPI000DBEE0BB|nr:odorant receptor 13a [Harpegnathos saltator]
MTFMGLWPEERNFSQASSYRVLAPVISMLCFICVPQSINLFFIWGDFDLMLENLSMANITITISLLKTVAFWSKGRPLKSLVTSMSRDWNTIVSKQDRSTMLDIACTSRSLSRNSVLLVQFVVVMYITLRFFMIRHNGRQLFFPAYFPYNWTNSPSYELTFLAQFVATMYAANTYTAVDTFIAMLVLHTCGQLSNLRRELTGLQAVRRAEFRGKLGNIVRKHEYLNRFAGTIEDSFNKMLLMQMLGCSLQVCVQCLQALTSVIDEANELVIFQFIFLVFYVIYILLQLYLYCYIGERLLIESTKIGYAAYDCNWYNLSPHEARSLMIIMCRTRSPLHISAGGFCSFNRELYSEILKRSVAYMSCIYAVK